MPHAEPGSTTRASVLLLRDGRWREDNLDGVFPADSFDVTVAPLTGDRNDEGAGVHVDLVLLTFAPRATQAESDAIVGHVRRAQPRVPILVYAASALEHCHEAWLEAGADDCISGPARPSLVSAHVRALLRRSHPPVGGHAVEVGNVSISPDHRKLVGPNTSVPLTQREYALLAVFLSEP